jgi:hypothetical protein
LARFKILSIIHRIKKVRSTATFVEKAVPNRVLKVRSTVTFALFPLMLRCYAPFNCVLIPICYKCCSATHLFILQKGLNAHNHSVGNRLSLKPCQRYDDVSLFVTKLNSYRIKGKNRFNICIDRLHRNSSQKVTVKCNRI